MHFHALDTLWGGLPIVTVLRAPPTPSFLNSSNAAATTNNLLIIQIIMIIISASLFLCVCHVLVTLIWALHMLFYVILAYFFVSPPLP